MERFKLMESEAEGMAPAPQAFFVPLLMPIMVPQLRMVLLTEPRRPKAWPWP